MHNEARIGAANKARKISELANAALSDASGLDWMKPNQDWFVGYVWMNFRFSLIAVVVWFDFKKFKQTGIKQTTEIHQTNSPCDFPHWLPQSTKWNGELIK